MSFIIDPLISNVMEILLEEDLTWISEEVEEVISGGKPETYVVQEDRSGGSLGYKLGRRVSPEDTAVSSEKTRTKLLPFSKEEQVNILTGILETYSKECSDIIEEINLHANDLWPNTGGDAIKISFVNDVTSEKFDIHHYDKATISIVISSLRQLLLAPPTPMETQP